MNMEKVEKCCVVKCNKVAEFQIGDNDKPNHESSFVCEEHKNTLVHDWIAEYKGDAEDKKREDTLKFVRNIIRGKIVEDKDVIAETPEYKFARGLVNFKLREILKEIEDSK